MREQPGSVMFWIFVGFLLLNTAFRHSEAADFALLADLENGTIFAGTMGQGLLDIFPLPLSGVKRPVAVDYDPLERMVYWSDLNSVPFPRISRAHINGSNQMVVADDLDLPDGLALDVEARMIYWTEGNIGYIGRARMNGTGSKEIIVEDLGKPRSIIADHDSGYIYWTDWGNSSKIERANLDGANRMTLVDDGLVWPNGITKYGNSLYWCDANLDKIEYSDLLGNSRSLLIDLSTYPAIHPFDLAVYDGYVYWTDWVVRTVARVLLNGEGENNYGPSVLEQAGGIHIEREPSYCESSPCVNGATCVDVINGFSCECHPGFQGVTCSENPCGSRPCMNGGTCRIESGAFSCQCSVGYDGSTCAIVAHCAFSLDPSDVLLVVSGQQTVYLPGDTIQYACPDGYQLSGSITRFCLSDFTWSGQPTTCTQDHCDSGPCANGGTCSSESDGFACQCPIGYDGPVCDIVAHCVLILEPSDVLIVVQPRLAVYVPGNSVTFDCPAGYQLSGSATRFCQTNFLWSGQPAECIPEDHCGSGPCANGGTCSSESDGFACQCPVGYDGPICDIVAHCVLILEPSDVLIVVQPRLAVYVPGNSVTFDCPAGYQLSGSATRFCQTNFLWTGQPAECIPEATESTQSPLTASNRCAIGPCLNGGSCTSSSSGFTCTCPSGYNGPICEKGVGCQRPATSSHATLVEANITLFPIGEEATLICDDGYMVKGSTDHSAKRVCRSDGTWSGEQLECSVDSRTIPGQEKIPVPLIAGGGSGVILVIAILLVALVFIRRKRRDSEERIVQLPAVISTVTEGDYAEPPPYSFDENPIYEETIFGRSEQPNDDIRISHTYLDCL